MEVRVRPLLVGIVRFTLEPERRGTRVGMYERPVRGPLGRLHNPLFDWIVKKRNDETLRRLERVALSRAATV
jgi:hypothetical protein